jgi:hypothetical protein
MPEALVKAKEWLVDLVGIQLLSRLALFVNFFLL